MIFETKHFRAEKSPPLTAPTQKAEFRVQKAV